MATQAIVLLLLLGMPAASGRGNNIRGTFWWRHFPEQMRADPWSRYVGQPEVKPGNDHCGRLKQPLTATLTTTMKASLGKRDNEAEASHLSARRRGSFRPTKAFLLVRGGAKVAPPTPSRGKGGNSRSVLGPITRQGYDDAENNEELQKEEFSPQFLDFQSRVGFMKKVYLTVSCQLVYTGVICRLMRGYRDPILRLLFTNGNVPQVLFVVGTIGTIIATHATLWANVDLRQNFPKNVPLLTLFTTAWAAYVGVFSLMFTQGSVTMAVFQTAFVVGSLTAYAFRTNPKHELTQFGAGLYSAGNALAMFCLMKLFFFRHHRASDLALSCLATLFFSLFLVFDTYRIIGGKHRRSSMFGVKDWAMAAIALYEDIMQIFIHLLALFGKAER